MLSQFAYHVCPGNHDITCHDYGDEFCPEELRNFSVYRQWFNMPSSVGPNLWHSFDFGNTHGYQMFGKSLRTSTFCVYKYRVAQMFLKWDL